MPTNTRSLIIGLAAIVQLGGILPCQAIDGTTPIIGPLVKPLDDLIGTDTNTSTTTNTTTTKPAKVPSDGDFKEGPPATKDRGQLTDYCDVQCTYDNAHGKTGKHQMVYPDQI